MTYDKLSFPTIFTTNIERYEIPSSSADRIIRERSPGSSVSLTDWGPKIAAGTSHTAWAQDDAPVNLLWLYTKTMLGYKYGREATDFAHTLQTDEREAVREGLTCSWEVAKHFGSRKSSSTYRRRWSSML